MAAPRKVVELFYDVVSPYSWVGFEILCRYKNVWNVDLRLRPGFLGGIMKESGNRPPGVIPSKFIYMSSDLRRLRDYCHIPFNMPANPAEAIFEKSSLSAMRFVTAVDMTAPAFLEPVSRELWLRIWSQDEDITKPESLAAAAARAGLKLEQTQSLLGMVSSAEVKNRLKQTTDEALKHGAFGMPTIVAHVDGVPHMYFGSDRFELLAYLLGEKWLGPIPEQPTSKL
ncbi:glutathione S-transferase kappa 1 [Latimeria chalumnae]|uniref:glutathione S-transferase kappa 1 n=1 Tax=Latimeria chalumnae TaxID=7897 RepID=UPI00313E7A87